MTNVTSKFEHVEIENCLSSKAGRSLALLMLSVEIFINVYEFLSFVMVRSTLLCLFSSGGPPGSIRGFNDSVCFHEVFLIFSFDSGATLRQLLDAF